VFALHPLTPPLDLASSSSLDPELTTPRGRKQAYLSGMIGLRHDQV